jgi:hypothetical protein
MTYLTDVLQNSRSRLKSGMRVRHLVLLGPIRRRHTKHGTFIYWLCRCDCGKEVEVRTSILGSGDKASCGCRKHGHSYRQELGLSCWNNMKDRCGNPNNSKYHLYGGKGVKVCERWRHSFLDFLADMGERPSRKHSIDRIDGNGNYEPGNCRWATAEEQALNTERNRRLTAFGQTMPLSVWAKRCGIHHKTLTNRINRGWDLERALTAPTRIRRRS